MSRRLRCAIYTRKSSEEGLDQSFNSLHAQRESCEAYVLSQAGEGWSAIKTGYDDGGYSGGSLERPGLQQLLADTRAGSVDVVVVYKVDRLTRSLADFAKIVELFDERGVSFVSVTQAFNTTTSMGRLTLNVLLSFAQFEREVAGERIRDKIAASKAKGLRMGGRPPLGYDIRDGRLAVNEAEAETVRYIFSRYLAVGSTLRLAAELRRDGIVSKRWTTAGGQQAGGGFMGPGALGYFLKNSGYRGETRHKDRRYPDTHPAIVDLQTWAAVQARLKQGNGRQPSTPSKRENSTLRGLLFDARGVRLAPVHTTKGPRRYRYYVGGTDPAAGPEGGAATRLSADFIENILVAALAARLTPHWLPDAEDHVRVNEAAIKVVILPDEVVASIKNEALPIGASGELRFPLQSGRIPGSLARERLAKTAAQLDRALVRALVKAQAWARQLERGEIESVKALARQNRLCVRYTARLLPLAYLAPEVAAGILDGRQPRSLTLSALTAEPLPLDWAAQRRLVDSLR